MTAALAIERAARERPLLFRADMVRAMLAGQKTKTRRVAQTRRVMPTALWFRGFDPGKPGDLHEILAQCPHGVAGDRIWVKESWRVDSVWDGLRPSAVLPNSTVFYEAGGERWGGEPTPICGKFRQSIFMPRWASRLDLDISAVHLERVQEISEGDARAEGAGIEELEEPPYSIIRNVGCPACSGDRDGIPALCHPLMRGRARPFACRYANLWDATNAHRAGCSWAENPWVFAITFGVVS